MKRISLSRTEKGVLAKWTFMLNKNIYYPGLFMTHKKTMRCMAKILNSINIKHSPKK